MKIEVLVDQNTMNQLNIFAKAEKTNVTLVATELLRKAATGQFNEWLEASTQYDRAHSHEKRRR